MAETSIFSRVLGLNNEIAQSLGVVFGIAMTTMLLMVMGGLSQIVKHRGNAYQRAGAKATTIHAVLGLALSFALVLLLNLADKAFGAVRASEGLNPVGF